MLLKAVPREEMPPELQAVYDLAEQRVGDTKFVEAGAAAPEVLDWYFNSFYAKVFYGGRVPVRTKEIARLRLSKTHGCAFCNIWNTVDAIDAGLTQEQCDAISWYPKPVPAELFEPADLAVIEYADQMVLQNMDGWLSPEIYARLKDHFDDGQLFELGVTMAVLTGMAKFLFIADLVPKEANCPVPGELAAAGAA